MFGSNANGVHVIHKTFERYLLTQNKPWNYFPLWLHCCKLEPIWKEVSFCLNPASMSGNALIFGVRKFYTSEKKSLHICTCIRRVRSWLRSFCIVFFCCYHHYTDIWKNMTVWRYYLIFSAPWKKGKKIKMVIMTMIRKTRNASLQ